MPGQQYLSDDDIRVYLFTGFLDSGKTTFIQETLGDSRFNQGESTLLLMCEEGKIPCRRMASPQPSHVRGQSQSSEW